jgi:hypothetical protein
MRANEHYIPFDDLVPLLEELRTASLHLDRKRAREVLKRAVAGYTPENGIEDLVWAKKYNTAEEGVSDKVIDITTRRA